MLHRATLIVVSVLTCFLAHAEVDLDERETLIQRHDMLEIEDAKQRASTNRRSLVSGCLSDPLPTTPRTPNYVIDRQDVHIVIWHEPCELDPSSAAVLMRITPANEPFICSLRFVVVQDGIQYDSTKIVNTVDGTSFCGYLLIESTFLLDQYSFLTNFDDSRAFTLMHTETLEPTLSVDIPTYDPDGLSTLARAYLMTTTTSPLGNISKLHIINTSSFEQQFSGTLYEYTGTQLGDSRVALHPGVIPPHGRLVISSADLEEILGIGPWQHPAMLDVFGSADFELMIKLTSPSGFVSNTNCVSDTEVHNIEGSDSPDLTFIRFINIGDTSTVAIYANLYNEAGNNIGASNVNLGYLGPRQQAWLSSNYLANAFGEQWLGTATLKVEAQTNLKLLNLNYVDWKTFFNFSCFESTRSEPTKIYVPVQVQVPVEVYPIDSEIWDWFDGWDGDTRLELANGQVWQQSSYAWEYAFEFYPWVVIYPVGGGLYKAIVEGCDERPYVVRIQ